MAKRQIEKTFHNVTVIDLRVGCNNSCSFCTTLQKLEDPDPLELAEAIGCEANDEYKEIVFCGGEPTLYRHLPSLLKKAVATGFNKVVLKTNGRMLCYEPYARKISESGVSDIKILLPAACSGTYSAVCADADGFAQTVTGIRNIVAADTDIRISITIPLLETNYSELPEIISLCTDLDIKHISLVNRFSSASEGSELEPTFNERLRESFRKAARMEVEIVTDDMLDESLKRMLAEEVRQKSDEIDDRGAIMFCPTNYVGYTANPEVLEALIRPNFTCNQICNFCWVDRETPNPSPDEVLGLVAKAGKDGVCRLTFSGGEPTLNSRLPEFIRTAKDTGVRETVIHTNAVRLADPALCRALDDAGLDIAYVTLLAHNSELSDSITRTEGTFRKTVSGIQNLLLHTDIHVFLHFVVTKDNFRCLPDFIEFVDSTFTSAEGRKVPVTFSYIAPPKKEIIPYVPKYSEAAPFLMEAMRMCEDRGIPFGGNEGLKSLPPCIIGGDPRYYRTIVPLMRESDSADFVKKDDCRQCCFDDFCFGVRKLYSMYFGLDEINPICRQTEK